MGEPRDGSGPLRHVVDPDVDLHDLGDEAETAFREWDILTAIAAGGVLGAEARYGLARLIPHPAHAWPWATLATNAAGSLLIGVLMAWLLARKHPPRLTRPFLGVGVLGGFTTFSTFAVETHGLLLAHRVAVAFGYVAVSVLVCLVAVAAGGALGRLVVGHPA
jgi:fluoride exporter